MALTPLLMLVAGGMLGGICASRPQQIAWPFLRLIGIMVAVVTVSVVVWSILRPDRVEPSSGLADMTSRLALLMTAISAAGSIGLLTLAPLAARYPAAVRWMCGLGGVAGVVAACAWWRCGDTTSVTSLWLMGVVYLDFGLAAWLTGTVTLAWLLGHAYLTATKMTIEPLRRLSKLLCVAIVVRVVFVFGSITVAYLVGGDELTSRFSREWLILAVRVIAGLLTVGVFSYMVLECVKLRSTQSATGLLYFNSVLVYIGELSSQYLTGRLGWPV